MTSRAQEVLHVRSELSSLSEDLTTQRNAWSAATASLEQENRVLKQKVEATAVPDVETAQKKVKKIKMAKSTTLAEIKRTNASRAHSSLAWESREEEYKVQIAALDAAAAQNVTLLQDQNTFLQKRYDQVAGDIP